MSIYKRGKVYWYKFVWSGELIRESTRQGNDKVARQIEAAHRTSLAKGEVGIRERKAIPALGDFCKNRLEPWAKNKFGKTRRNSWLWFRNNIKVICNPVYKISTLRMTEVTNERIAEFASLRLEKGYAVSTVNSTIRVIRRALRLGVEWGVIETAPRIQRLSGERQREHVVTPAEQEQYLALAGKHDPELGYAVLSLIETGMRPDEFYRMRWEHINWRSGNNGTIRIESGKTAAAKRTLPITVRLRFVLEARWEQMDKPNEGWVWPSKTKSGHFEQSTLKKRHTKLLSECAKEVAKQKAAGKKGVPVRTFVFYNLRHTYLTRLGESGCDVWTLARIAGHSSIAMSQRYVHPSEAAVESAMSRMSGHNSGHSDESAVFEETNKLPASAESERDEWCARRDSNSRPVASEATALSS